MAIKVQWTNLNSGSSDRGQEADWRSVEGRFWIEELCMGRTTAQAYYLHDKIRETRTMRDTVKECKDRATAIVNEEINKARKYYGVS